MMTLKFAPITSILKRCLQTPFSALFKAHGFLHNLTISQMNHMESLYDSSSLTNEKDHHYFLNSADVCW